MLVAPNSASRCLFAATKRQRKNSRTAAQAPEQRTGEWVPADAGASESEKDLIKEGTHQTAMMRAGPPPTQTDRDRLNGT